MSHKYKLIQKIVSAFLCMTIIMVGNVVIGGGFAKVASASSGTVTFSNDDDFNGESTVTDGQGGSTDISGITLEIASGDGYSWTYATPYGPDSVIAPGYIGNLEQTLITIKSDDTAVNFNFMSFLVVDSGGSPIVVTGYDDGQVTGSVNLDTTQNGYANTFDSSNGLTSSLFQNVDEVRIAPDTSIDGVTAMWIGINDIEIGPPSTAPSDLALSSSTIAENQPANTTIGTLSATDADAGSTFTYSLVSGSGSTDNASFNINGNELRATNSLNYESKSSYSVRVRVTDNGGLTYEEAFTIAVTDVNEAPTDLSLSSNSIAENAAANTTVGTLSATDADAGSTFTYTLVGGSGSTDNASFNISGNQLRATNSLDYETKNSYSVRVGVTDNGGLTYEKAFTVNVTQVNEAPTDLALSASSIAENAAANTTVGTLSATDPNSSSTFTYTLVSGSGSTDNASFNISGSALRATNSLDFETKSSYSVRIRVTDNGGLTYEEAFAIAVTDNNEAPTDLAPSSTSIAENGAANATVGTLSATDEDAASTFTYALVNGSGSDDNASFNINGNALRATNSLDYETKSSYSVRVKVTDNGTPGLTYEEAFTIVVTDANEAPTDLSLSSTSIAENAAANTTVGTLSAADEDAGSTFTYALVNGSGSTDNASFNISGNQLRATNSLDYETKNSYSVRVGVTDNGGLTYEEAFTINVTQVNEAPTDLALSSASIAENQPANTSVGTLSATDPNSASAFTFELVSGNGDDDNASFNISGNQLRATNMLDYETKNSYSVRIKVTDNGTPGLTYEEALAINVTDVNENAAHVSETKPTSTEVDVLVNGKIENAGTATTDVVNGQQVTTIAVNEDKMRQRLLAEGDGATITIHVPMRSDVVVGELNGRMIKNMENQQATVELRTENASYTLPADEINIDAISKRFGQNLALQDIKVRIEIAEPLTDTVQVVNDAVRRNGLTLVIPPLNFKVTAVYGDRTEEITNFNAYVDRMVAIPEGVDPNRITTGTVIEPDGTVRHVPTKIVQIEGKYYARISSLTNSTYSVVWHPLEFTDMANHWAKDAVNDMGSRMVVEGTGNGAFNPDRDITRAEFAAIIVKALGLRLEKGESSFKDVKQSDWYGSAVQTAHEYGLINGFEDGMFRPNDKITREQAMQIIANAMNVTGLSDRLPASSSEAMLGSYQDAEDVAAWAESSAAKSVQAGVVSGRDGKKLAPKAYITRAEVAVIVQRLLAKSELI